MHKRRLDKLEAAADADAATFGPDERFRRLLVAMAAGADAAIKRLATTAPRETWTYRQPAFIQRFETGLTLILLISHQLDWHLLLWRGWDAMQVLLRGTVQQHWEYGQEMYRMGIEAGLQMAGAEVSEEQVEAAVEAVAPSEGLTDVLTRGEEMAGCVAVDMMDTDDELRAQLAAVWREFEEFAQEHWGVDGVTAAAAWGEWVDVNAVLEVIDGVEPDAEYAAEWGASLRQMWEMASHAFG